MHIEYHSLKMKIFKIVPSSYSAFHNNHINELYINGHSADNVHVIFLSSLGSKQPRAAVGIQLQLRTQNQPLPSQVPICTPG